MKKEITINDLHPCIFMKILKFAEYTNEIRLVCKQWCNILDRLAPTEYVINSWQLHGRFSDSIPQIFLNFHRKRVYFKLLYIDLANTDSFWKQKSQCSLILGMKFYYCKYDASVLSTIIEHCRSLKEITFCGYNNSKLTKKVATSNFNLIHHLNDLFGQIENEKIVNRVVRTVVISFEDDPSNQASLFSSLFERMKKVFPRLNFVKLMVDFQSVNYLVNELMSLLKEKFPYLITTVKSRRNGKNQREFVIDGGSNRPITRLSDTVKYEIGKPLEELLNENSQLKSLHITKKLKDKKIEPYHTFIDICKILIKTQKKELKLDFGGEFTYPKNPATNRSLQILEITNNSLTINRINSNFLSSFKNLNHLHLTNINYQIFNEIFATLNNLGELSIINYVDMLDMPKHKITIIEHRNIKKLTAPFDFLNNTEYKLKNVESVHFRRMGSIKELNLYTNLEFIEKMFCPRLKKLSITLAKQPGKRSHFYKQRFLDWSRSVLQPFPCLRYFNYVNLNCNKDVTFHKDDIAKIFKLFRKIRTINVQDSFYENQMWYMNVN